MKRGILLAAMLASSMLFLGACGSSGAREEGPEFSVTTLDGDEFRLADKRGEVVALYFTAAY